MKTITIKSEYSDRKFERIGVTRQYDANNFVQAKHDFMRSCELCCTTGVGGAMKCASCPIRSAFLDNGNIFWNKLSDTDKAFVQEERDLR